MIYYILNIVDWARAYVKDGNNVPPINDSTIKYLLERTRYSILHENKMENNL